MAHVTREKDRECLLDERRRLLEYVLEVYKAKGGKMQLPIGMNTAEAWLLDAVDVQSLLAGLHHSKAAGTLDLLQYVRKASSRSITTEAAVHGRSSRRETSLDGGDTEKDAPTLNLPQLNTGLSESEIKDLAYLVFACNCSKGVDADLLHTVRSQLDVDESRAAEVGRLLGMVNNTLSTMQQTTGQLPVSKLWTANLELPVCLLGTVLPKDFSRFRSFVVWRDTLSHVLLATLAQSVRDSWSPPPQQAGDIAPTAQQLMAKLKAALRRCDVRDADDFDELEYQDASKAVGQHTTALVKCTFAGWRFPWGLRVRLCEMLLRGVFDTLDESSYIEGADEYLKLLQERLWPLLGISPAMHNAGFAWIHFRQFVLNRDPGLLAKSKTLLKRLAQMSTQDAKGHQGPTSAAISAISSSPEDNALTREVGSAVIDWIAERLSDYHARLSGVGGPEVLPGLVDMLAFAAVSRGASEDDVGDMMAAAVRSSVDKELQRRLSTEGPYDDEAGNITALCGTIVTIAKEQLDTWARGFSCQLLEAAPLSLAVLHAAAGARILPWLGTITSLDDSTCKALQAAMDLEPLLLGPVASAAPGCHHPAVGKTLVSARSWDVPTQLQPVLAAWVDKQISGFSVWVDRQLQQENWEPLGQQQPHSGSARELRRIAMESLEALFDLGLPLPAAIVSMHMEGIDNMMHRYLQGILTRLGNWSDMMPNMPPLTRYKREVAVKQEEAESGMKGLPEHLPPVGAVSRKGVSFMESVKRIEQEPCFNRMADFTSQVLVVMMASLGYLLDTLQPIATAVAEKWTEEQRRTTNSSSSGGGANYHPTSSSNGGADNADPFAGRSALQDHWGSGGGLGEGFGKPDDNGHNTQGIRGFGVWGSAGGVGNPTQQSHAEPYDVTNVNHTQGFRQYGAVANGTGPTKDGDDQSWGAGWGLGTTEQQNHQGTLRQQANPPGYGAVMQLRQPQIPSEEMFSSMLEAAAQSLRSGIAAVNKWLAVRVVWWEQRAGWCELLYRHRVTSCRIDWLLDGLGDVLGGAIGLLPNGPRLDVAAAILREAAAAMERVYLDGGPCRWYIPADVQHLEDDLESLRRLFYADGDGLSMQEINTSLLGLQQLLKLMAKPSGHLIETHRAARLASLKADAAAAGYGQHSAYGGGTTPYAGNTGSSLTSTQQHQGGPLSSRLKIAPSNPALSNAPSAASTVPAAATAAALLKNAAPAALSRTAPSGASAVTVAATATGGSGGSGTESPRAGYGKVAGQQQQVVSALAIAAGGGDVGGNEQVLLKVLCHRAEHAASKYLKETLGVKKAKDDGFSGAFSRFKVKF